jgi:hypothetical protein
LFLIFDESLKIKSPLIPITWEEDEEEDDIMDMDNKENEKQQDGLELD